MYLAAIHYNENCDRAIIQEPDESGQPKLRVEFVKWMAGRGKAKVVRQKPTKGILNVLIIVVVIKIGSKSNW